MDTIRDHGLEFRVVLPRDGRIADAAAPAAAAPRSIRPSPARTVRCDNCRRKRIKCDNKLPRCTKCVMCNLDCQPFKKQFQFVFSGEVEQTGAFKRGQPGRSVPSSHTSGQYTVPPNPFVAPSIHRIAILDRYYSFTLPLDRNDWGYQLEFLVSALGNKNLSIISVAVASSFCSSVSNDANLQAAGLKAYVKAVSYMRSIAVSFKQNWGQLLMASVTLFLYEFNVPSSIFYSTSTGMKSHVLGITSILKLVGSAAFQSEPFHSMFLLARGILINRGILQRTPPFAMEGDWLTIPWAKNSKTLVDKIMDCKGKLPTIWERVIEPCKGVASSSLPFCDVCRETRQLIHQLQTQLDEWVAGYAKELPHLAGVSSAAEDDTSQSKQPFRSYPEAAPLLLYWETRLVLYSLLWRTGKRPIEICHDGISRDLEYWDAVFIGATQAISRNAAFIVGPGIGSWYRDSFVSAIHAAGAFCERRGGLGELGDRILYLQKYTIESWDKDRFASPMLVLLENSSQSPS